MTEVVQEPSDESKSGSPLLGERLKEARERAELSQAQVHDALGFPIRSLTRWECGESDPGFEKVKMLAELYKVSLDWIARRTETEDLLVPGTIIVRMDVIPRLQALVDEGKSLEDVPKELIRDPGIDFACVVPENAMTMRADGVESMERQVKLLFEILKRRK